jgi:DNA-binding Lrp family transcriptional regulator
MDELDHQLIAHLRADARKSVSSLAASPGVSRATVRSRMERLIERGVIEGFTIVVNSGDPMQAVRAITSIAVEGPSAEALVATLHGYPEVRTLSTTNGRWDLIAGLECRSLPELDDTLR